MVIAGNKADLEDERIVTDQQIKELSSEFNTDCFLTSAVTGVNVEEAFHQLINMIAPAKMDQLS